MEGTPDARGVNYRTLQKLFEIITERKGDFKYEVSVNVLEVYNEQIRDLLACASQPGTIAKRYNYFCTIMFFLQVKLKLIFLGWK